MYTIKYVTEHSDRYATIAIEVKPTFEELGQPYSEPGATPEQLELWRAIMKLFRDKNINGQVLFWWMKGQQCELFASQQISQMYYFAGSSNPAHPAPHFNYLTPHFLMHNDPDIDQYIA